MDRSPVHADERCGLVTSKGEKPVDRRFEILAEHKGRAFVDMRTCRLGLYPWKKAELTLDDAMEVCSTFGQCGTSKRGVRKSQPWPKSQALIQRAGTNKNKNLQSSSCQLLKEMRHPNWTVTPWLGNPNSQAGVIFSVRTTLVTPFKQDAKAAIWCVRGYPATGLH